MVKQKRGIPRPVKLYIPTPTPELEPEPQACPSNSTPGPYHSLECALLEALWRASQGKGKERHAEDKPFEQQDILTELRTFGPTPAIFQIRKKAKESLRLSKERGADEALDIIVYAAALWLYYKEED